MAVDLAMVPAEVVELPQLMKKMLKNEVALPPLETLELVSEAGARDAA